MHLLHKFRVPYIFDPSPTLNTELSFTSENFVSFVLLQLFFILLDIKGINDIRLIFRSIHAPSHELEDKGKFFTRNSLTKNFNCRI